MYPVLGESVWYLTILLRDTITLSTYKIKPTSEHPHINNNRRTKAKNLMMKEFQIPYFPAHNSHHDFFVRNLKKKMMNLF
jgi:hypothetical protein